MSSQDKPPLTYRDAGVDIDGGNLLIERLKPIAKKTHRAGVLGSLGGFGALFDLSQLNYRQPVLVASTDGVGTKVKLAIATERYDTIGIDLVAMCVNDLIVLGAEPLFFLDYYATGQLDIEVASEVIKGIGFGCELAGAALTGGETAEMPGLYAGNDYDLAGFCVGVVERDQIIDGEQIQAGDAIIGLASSGPHSNGYSLIRAILERDDIDLSQAFDNRRLADALLEPTRIYVKPLLNLLKTAPIKAMAHITGGGILENIPRVMPAGTRANINPQAWTRPPIFAWLQDHGNVSEQEMLRTFNCGIGMIVIVSDEHADTTIDNLQAAGEVAWRIGTIEENGQEDPYVITGHA